MSFAISTEVTPLMAAIERSISLTSSTNIRPSAMMPTTVLCTSRFERLRGVRNTSLCEAKNTHSATGQPFISAYCASKGALATLTRNTAFAVAANRIRVNQLDIGWMASDHERELQAATSGDPDWEAKASAALPFGRLVDPAEAARAVNFMVSDDAGLMTGAIVNFDQTVWGAAVGGMPVPDGPMRL